MDKAILEKHKAERALAIPEEKKWRNSEKWVFVPGDADYAVISEMIQCVDETKDYLYDEYTPLAVERLPGTRPELERIVDELRAASRDEEQLTLRIFDWLYRHVESPMRFPLDDPRKKQARGRASVSEEEMIRRGHAYCSSMSRVFATLCQIGGVPARCLLLYRPEGTGHAANEAYVKGKWRFFDPTFAIFVRDADGDIASAWEIHSDPSLARKALEQYRHLQAELTVHDQWREYDYGELFWAVTIGNYPLSMSNRFFAAAEKP